jgi:hypothetical protein
MFVTTIDATPQVKGRRFVDEMSVATELSGQKYALIPQSGYQRTLEQMQLKIRKRVVCPSNQTDES